VARQETWYPVMPCEPYSVENGPRWLAQWDMISRPKSVIGTEGARAEPLESPRHPREVIGTALVHVVKNKTEAA
jgi:hypothetical protein